MRILFVDDDYELSITVRALKARFPMHEVMLANTIKKTFDLLKREQFDVIVMDIMFPGGDDLVPGSDTDAGLFTGIRLDEMIRRGEFERNSNTKIFFLTALDTENHHEISDLSERVGERLMFKPIHTTEIAKQIGISV